MIKTCRAAFASALCLLLGLLLTAKAAAADLADYRTDKPDTRIASVPDEIRQAIFVRPTETIEPLVRWLVRDVRDDYRKVKLLHDWIADNIDYDVEAFLSGRPGETSWQERSAAAGPSARATPPCCRKCARSPAFPVK